MSNHTNSLTNETSPYLLQHATNPVAWYPWAATALERARQENKPILLSIGYSACHWCHVMAHESFEDEETASIMNDMYVNIKVDREERPDLDKIYQTAHQILTQRSGGWPLTVFLAPDTHAPFFAGTYFPKLPRYGMPAFKDLLTHLAHNFHNKHEELREQNSRFLDFLAHFDKQQRTHQGSLNVDPLEKARFELEQHFDAEHGGFGAAPKFPHPTNLERLLRHWAMTQHTAHPDNKALTMATKTLKKMARGGIYDQLGGGFCRYSVDAQWLIPHFEKMLYDNGPLLELYATLWQVTNDPDSRRTAEDIGNWFIHQMQSPEGGFYSSIDADSEGVEGKFYVWQREDIRSLLDDDEFALIEPYFGLDKPTNFEGHWHLFIADDTPSFSNRQGHSLSQWQTQRNNARSKLLAARNKRIAPGRDEKILTSWNGLAIKGLANAGRLLQRPDFINAASTALDFIRSRLWQNNRLLATYKEDRAHLPAYLDDYAFLLDAILALLQARWRDEDLDFAIALADTLLNQFEDGEQGGFFFTANDHEPLIQRPRHFADDALPSGNGVAAFSLARLGHLLGETRYLDATERCLKAGWQSIIETPFAHNAMLAALEEILFPPQLIFLRGNETQIQTWQHRCTKTYEPRRLVFAITQGGERLPGSQDVRSTNSVVAYRCDGFACSAPITSLDQLLSEINRIEN